jgi:5'-nucleotidase
MGCCVDDKGADVRAFLLTGSRGRGVGAMAALGAALCAVSPAVASGDSAHGNGRAIGLAASGPTNVASAAGRTDAAQPAPSKLGPTFACALTVTGSVNGGLVVPPGERYCLIGARVNGAVSVRGGGDVVVEGSTVNGGLRSTEGATGVRICASRINGATTIQNGEGKLLIGADVEDGSTECPGNILHGTVTIGANRGVIELEDDWITGGLTLIGNEGVAFEGSSAGAEVESSRIAGPLVCQANSPAPVNDGLANHVTGPELGQCAGF